MTRRLLGGQPSDETPEVLAAGRTDVAYVFVSLSARQPEGRDADYLEWHSLDHRPEQYRVAGLRHSLRLVSTPECRAARAASEGPFDAVDHVMTYFFTGLGSLEPFDQLSKALTGGRRPVSLPSVEYGVYEVAGKVADRQAVIGADVVPWRPALGVYLLLEEGHLPSADLVDVEGVAGVWWHTGLDLADPLPLARAGRQLTYCYLEDDPPAVARRLEPVLARRWAPGTARPLLAAPLRTLVPFEWGRYVP